MFMRKKTKSIVTILVSLCMMAAFILPTFSLSSDSLMPRDSVPINAEDSVSFDLDCKSAILMEASTGKILYEQNADEALPPASVTKIMTLLLVMEAIEAGQISLADTVTASAHAASMGGSQIYLKEGERMSVEDMLKSVVIASANDAACALAEFVSGSEELFVARMNERARELGMNNTSFENTNGLDDTALSHLTSARDIAIMSRELIKHKKILEYSSIWMDSIRNGLFGLTNTNRLVRFYKGCTGLKTGSTSKAGFCISATAERDGVSLICVIMGSSSRDARNSAATTLLNYGFANYKVYTHTEENIDALKVNMGVKNNVKVESNSFSCVIEKQNSSRIKYSVDLPEYIVAPIKKGDKVGVIKYTLDGELIGESDIVAAEDVEKISFFELWYRILAGFLLK